jgi:hypothetical protein
MSPQPGAASSRTRAAGCLGQIKRAAGLGDGRRCVVEIRLDEPRALGQVQLGGELAGGGDRQSREIEADDPRSTLRQNQAVSSEVALQVQDAQAVDRPQLGLLDRVQPAAPGSQSAQVVALGAKVNGEPLVPIRAVGLAPLLIRPDHANSPRTAAASPVRFI